MWEKIRRGITALFVGHLISTACNFLLVPLFLAKWSPTRYGEWLVLFSLAGYLSLLDLGRNTATANQLTQLHTQKNTAGYICCLHSSLALHLLLATAGTLLLIGVVPWLPLQSWFELKTVSRPEAIWAFLILGANVLWSIPAGLVASLYRTVGQFARAQWIGNIQNIAVFLALTGVLLLKGGFRTAALSQSLILMLISGYIVWDLRRILPSVPIGISQARLSVIRALITPSLFFFVVTVASLLVVQAPVLIIASAMGGTAVAVFAISRGLANLVREITDPLNAVLTPELTRLEIRGELSALRSLHCTCIVLLTTLAIAAAAALWFESADVIHVWTRGRLNADPILMRLLLAHLVFQCPWFASSTFTMAANRHRQVAFFMLASALIGVAAAIVLTRCFGTYGVPMGLILGEVVACYHFVLRDTCRMLGENYAAFARKVWVGTASVAALTLSAGWLAHQIAYNFWFPYRWLVVGLTTMTVASLVTWRFWLNAENRAALSRIRLMEFLPAQPVRGSS